MLEPERSHKKLTTKARRLLAILSFVALAMFGVSYALVPLYNVLCKQLGVNGKTSTEALPPAAKIDMSRIIEVQFLATNNANLPWDFHPMKKKVELHPGESVKVAFFAKNNTDHAMTVQAIPSVSPGQAASHIKKTQCFCFTQQTLKAHEQVEMPLIFHLDDTLPKNIRALTLSYTLFEATKKEVAKEKQGHL